jgi:DNA-binding CsgD family transcriptional regulator
MIEVYGLLIHSQESFIVTFLSGSIEKLAYATGIFFGPSFCFRLIGIIPGKQIWLLLRIAAILYIVTALGELLFKDKVSLFLQNGVGLVLLFGTYVILCLQAAFKLESLADAQLHKILKILFIISLLAFPPALYKYIYDRSFLPFHLENSLSLLVITIFSIVFALRFLNFPTFYDKGTLTDYFKSRFKTTTREDVIIHQAIQGKSNSEIADTLCISVRTVESHLYNIFQKTGVKNRVQLINLIASNRS